MLMPNGARILDQMGLFDATKEVLTAMRRTISRRDDVTEVTRNETSKLVEKR